MLKIYEKPNSTNFVDLISHKSKDDKYYTDQLLLSDFHVDNFQEGFQLHKFLWHIRENLGLGSESDAYERQEAVDDFERHATGKNRCDQNQNFFLHVCSNCKKKHWTKMICSSFFCPECHEQYTKKLRMSMMDYLMDCNHRLAVFTVPSEAWTKINWQNINKLYDVVRQSLDEYFNDKEVKQWYYGQAPQIGKIAILHSYGSLDIGWKPHINVFISTLGFIKCSKTFHQYNTQIPGTHKECLHDYHTVSTTFIDYNKLRTIYKKKLVEAFNLNLEKNFTPQIRFDENIEKADDMFDIAESCVQTKQQHKLAKGVPIKELLKNMVDYFRRIPFSSKDVTIVSNKYVGFTTYKRKALKLSWMFLDHRTFYHWIDQHIPKENFRNMRLWGVYHYQNKIKKFRSQKTMPPLKCDCLNFMRSIEPESTCKQCFYYAKCKKRYKCPDCNAALTLHPAGFFCSECERKVPFTYFSVGFTNDIDPRSDNPKCSKCGTDMDLVLGVMGGRVAFLSNYILDLGRDFSRLKKGDHVPSYLLGEIPKGGLPYG